MEERFFRAVELVFTAYAVPALIVPFVWLGRRLLAATFSLLLAAREDGVERGRERRVALLHGRMKPAERDDVMRRFRARELQVLVATTVIEVGVDVPNSTLMVVEGAERFGLAQLHQLPPRDSAATTSTIGPTGPRARRSSAMRRRTNTRCKSATCPSSSIPSTSPRSRA